MHSSYNTVALGGIRILTTSYRITKCEEQHNWIMRNGNRTVCKRAFAFSKVYTLELHPVPQLSIATH